MEQMDNLEYQEWSALHVRFARGEILTEEEQAIYQRGLKQLHEEEVLAGDVQSIREARDAVMALDSKCDELHARRQQLKEKIAVLEAALTPDMRKDIGIAE
jgi:hypothetical protein